MKWLNGVNTEDCAAPAGRRQVHALLRAPPGSASTQCAAAQSTLSRHVSWPRTHRAAKQFVQLSFIGSTMIEEAVEIACFGAETIGEHFGVEDTSKPLEADQSVY